MPAPVSVRKDESGYFWCVSYTCCETRRMRFHEWSLAQRIAAGHRCPPPFENAGFDRPKRLTRTIR